MPHLTIEYSSNLDGPISIQAMVDRVHTAALETGLPAADALRTRAARREHYRIADGDPSHGFLALTARIGPGRTPKAKLDFLEVLIDALEESIAPIASLYAVALSAEIQEIDADFRANRNHVRERMQPNQA